MSAAKHGNVLLCCSGSVATLKLPELYLELLKLQVNIKLILTTSALHFLNSCKSYRNDLWCSFVKEGGLKAIIHDQDEWCIWNNITDPVLHIQLRKWADVIIIAPASADILAKLSVGIADNLLLCTLRAVDLRKTPCIICPAMNTLMWSHPATEMALQRLRLWGFEIIEPIEKTLACNDTGKGALAAVAKIRDRTLELLKEQNFPERYSLQLNEDAHLLDSQIESCRNRRQGQVMIKFMINYSVAISVGIFVGIIFTTTLQRR